MGVDDSADEFRIGVGTALGSDRVFEINSSGVSVFQKAVQFAGSTPTVTVGDGGCCWGGFGQGGLVVVSYWE